MRTLYRVFLVALAVTPIASCGGRDPGATELRLADLVRFAQQYDDERVATTGVVHTHPEPEHYWIEDSDLNRVAVQPGSAVSGLVGKTVHIEGRFEYSPSEGRYIRAEHVAVIGQ